MDGATGAWSSRPLVAGAVRPGTGTIGWVRDARFDLLLILGVAAVALAVGGVVSLDAGLFWAVLFVDQWLLGQHHVVATFTRLAFDGESLRQHRFLVFGLPLLMAPAVVALYLGGGVEGLMTVYFYWQWFHYMRQSYGVERLFWRKAGGGDDGVLNSRLLYAVAIVGVAHRSWQQTPFLGTELFWLPVPEPVVWALGGVAGVLLLAWMAARLRDYRQGQLRLAHTLFLSSHVLVFAVAYLFIADVTHGWLVLNVWHNLQYLLIVWLFNTNRFKAGVDPRHRFLSTLSQPGRGAAYFAACLAIAVGVYLPLATVLGPLLVAGIPLVLVLTQLVNFHHYVADAVIWRLRRQPIRMQLGLAA